MSLPARTGSTAGRVLGWLGWALVALLVVPAALLTIVRLAGGDSSLVARVVSFAPFAIPLYAVALAVIAAIGLRRRSWRVGLVAVPLVIGLALHLAWIAPLYVGTTPPAARGAKPLVVMNANMYFGKGDATTLVEAVRRHRVGLLVVEELTPELLERLQATGLLALLPHSAGEAGAEGHGTMVFSSAPITDVHPVPTSLDSWSMTVDGLHVLAVHPAFAAPRDTWPADQATVLRTVRAEHPDLLVGDLNATLDHAAVRSLEAAGLSDGAAQANAGWDPTWPANGLFAIAGLRPPPLVEIDHVMVGPRLVVRSFEDVGVRGTDHRAVVATVVRRG